MKRKFVGAVAIICCLLTIGIVGNVECGGDIINILWCIPTIGIFTFNMWLLGYID